eukprot:1944386-Lingulodinium_polyedra.AAC.1
MVMGASTLLLMLVAATTQRRAGILPMRGRHWLWCGPSSTFAHHQPLQWLMTNTNLTGKLARWAMIIQEYHMTIVHRAGKDHVNADVLSRYAMPTT